MIYGYITVHVQYISCVYAKFCQIASYMYHIQPCSRFVNYMTKGKFYLINSKEKLQFDTPTLVTFYHRHHVELAVNLHVVYTEIISLSASFSNNEVPEKNVYKTLMLYWIDEQAVEYYLIYWKLTIGYMDLRNICELGTL